MNIDTDSVLPKWPGMLHPAIMIALLILLSLAGIANHELWTPDEPREAAIALSMSKTGNLVIPELAGKPFVEKPPLFYLIASFFLKTLGPFLTNTVALRLTSACFGLGTLFFTYLLGKIYFSRQRALLATGMLATMIGFVHVTHWLVVDGALMFFITACIWALAKAYEYDRLRYLPLAGILAALAFLTKGLIGPIIIFFAWLGLAGGWIYGKTETFNAQHSTLNIEPKPSRLTLDVQRWMFNVSRIPCTISHLLPKKILAIHLLSLGIALLISAAWVVAFAAQAGPELFHEWWWVNHFGRFTGESVNLGHISPWYYYFTILPFYVLPWIVPLVIALVAMFKKIRRGELLPAGALFLLLWLLGGFLLLSLSATKRDIYLGVLLPAGALLCAQELEDSGMRFARYQRLIIAMAIIWAVLLIIACPIIDQVKNYGPAFKKTAAFLRSHPELKTAGCDLDETTSAGLYYYCDLSLPLISGDETMAKILNGRSGRFNAVLVLCKNASSKDLSDRKNPVIFETRMGKRRVLQLIAAPDWDLKK